MSEVVRSTATQTLVFTADKKFALACKFFEYVFEPVLAKANSFFYERSFHKFIANLLYVSLTVRDASAEQMVEAYQRFMRTRNVAEISAMLAFNPNDERNPIANMLTFAEAYHDKIGDELDTLASSDGVGKWVLDLTSSALFSLLAAWGERLEKLDVYCDRSKPLESDQSLFDTMIGRSERSYMTFGKRSAPLTFDLAGPIKFVSSESHAGIQVADIVSGAVAYAMRGMTTGDAELFAGIGEVSTVFPLGPELDEYLNLDKRDAFLNRILLMQLVDRAVEGSDPLEGLVAEHLAFEAYYDVVGPPAIE
jgi:hypothetical protein